MPFPYHPAMQCDVRAIEYDFANRRAIVYMDEYNCVDMNGCIASILAIDPRAQSISTYAGRKLDTCYCRKGCGEWKSIDP